MGSTGVSGKSACRDQRDKVVAACGWRIRTHAAIGV